MNRRIQFLALGAALIGFLPLQGQELPDNIHTPEQYDAWKLQFMTPQPAMPQHPGPVMADGGAERDSIATCDCWVEPDNSYTTIQTPGGWNAGSIGNGDDGSYGPVQFPFSFYLYGQYYTEVYININGNLSFGAPYSTFTIQGFPNSSYTMVAPFWADVDLRGGTADQNKVMYKVTSDALYVNWMNVGYYNQQTDKLNSFQVILKAGDPTVDGQQNVSFCYGTMQWTTGSASGGSGGFGGQGATVGANKGDGVNYVQFGRFDHAGTDYNGPFGAPGGVGWLTGKHFTFATDITQANLAPVVTGQSVCDYLAVCTGEPVYLNMQFLSPEPDQITTTTSSAPGFPDYTILSNPPGQSSEINTTFTPTEPGTFTVTFSGTDNGSPALTTTVTIMVEVFQSANTVPVIAGDLTACEGVGTVLSVQNAGDFSNFNWSNGYNGSLVLVGPGTYTVSAGAGDCLVTSDPVTVTGAPSPHPVITGVLFKCGGDPAVLTTTEPYAGYAWSNGDTSPSTSVGTGTYTVTVTNDEGCPGTSAAVNVLTANPPTASFSSNPGGEVFPGTTVVFTDQSSGNGGTIVSWNWVIDTLATGTGTEFIYTFTEPGNYPVSLTVTTSDGCTHTYTYMQIVIPLEIKFPNVFSPNSDGQNDALVFEGAQYYPNTSLQVMDRWGKEVYSSTNYKNTWKPSKEIPDGTYFYILKLSNGKDYTGYVTLMR